MSNASDLLRQTNSKIKAQKQKKRKRKVRYFALIFSFCFIGIYFFITRPMFVVQSVVVTSIDQSLQEEVKSIVEQYLKERNFLFISNSNRFFMPQAHMKSMLVESFPKIKYVEMDIEDNVLSVQVVEKDGVYLYCTLDTQECLHSDSLGYIFDSVSVEKYEEEVMDKIVFYSDGQDSDVGNSITQQQTFDFALEVMSKLQSEDIRVYAVLLKENEYSFYVTDRRLDGARIIMNEEHTTEEYMTKFFTALRDEPLQSRYYEEQDMLQYVDLRFEDKVYFKFNE